VSLLGQEKTNVLKEMYEVINNAEQHGYTQGKAEGQSEFDTAWIDGHTTGYKEGFVDATNEASDDVCRAFENGYEHARIEMGECPMVDPDYDRLSDDDLYEEFDLPGKLVNGMWVFPTDGEARD
jgi:hypothetical protein